MGSTNAASRTHGAAASRVVGRHSRALVALAVAAGAGMVVAARMPLPDTVMHATAARTLPGDPLAPMWASMSAFIPGTPPARWSVLALSFALVLALASGWLGYRLFRGPGRVLAAFSATLLAITALTGWIFAAPLDEQFPALPFGVLAMAAVTALVRPLVHLGRVTPVAFARAIAAAAASAVVLPSAGLPLLAFCCATYLVRGRRIEDLRSPRADASLSRATMSGNIGMIVATALVGPVLAALVLWPGHADLASAWEWTGELRLIAPPVDRLRPYVHPYLIYPALTLVLLLVLPLRWRGGVTLLGLFAFALTVADASGPLATMPVLLCGMAIASAGWVWLAGSVARRPAVGRVLALAAGVGLAWMGLPSTWVRTPAAEARTTISLASLCLRAADSPGDVLVIHEPALLHELQTLQTRDGARPDLTPLAATSLSVSDVASVLEAAGNERRRLLSDAFDLGGRSDPGDAIEVGSVYWITTDEVQTRDADRAPLELPDPPAELSTPERARWTRLYLERARFRRAVGQDADAVLALPLGDERRSLRTAIRVSQAIHLPARPGSELGRVGDVEAVPPRAPILAEGGDLLFVAGEHALGLAMLTEAARMGYPPAWRALARWQLETGSTQSADELRALMTTDPDLREPALDVIWWLVWRERHSEATAWRDQLRPDDGDPIAELTMRLAVLSASTAEP